MRILITGNSGFIGSHLNKYLKTLGHEVKGIDNFSHPCLNDVLSADVDVRNMRDLMNYMIGTDIVFHLAAQISVDKSIEDPKETLETNILGTQNVLELAKLFKVKVVFASSSEIYGSAQTAFMDESHPLDSQSPYAASKVAGDRLCHSYISTYGLKVNIVRNFNTFGSFQTDDSYGGVIAKFTTAALNGKDLIIFGDGLQERDYMDIKDAIQAYFLALTTEFNGPINFGSGKTVRIIDLAKAIIEITGSKSKIVHTVPRLGEVQRLCADITKAKRLGFNPVTDFYKDLEEYIAWKKG